MNVLFSCLNRGARIVASAGTAPAQQRVLNSGDRRRLTPAAAVLVALLTPAGSWCGPIQNVANPPQQNEVAGTPQQNQGQSSGPSTTAPGAASAGTTKAGATALAPAPGGIHEAAFKGDMERMQALIKDHSDLVSSKDEHGWTALEWAAYAGQKDAAAYLLAHNAEVNAKDNDGDTPLHRAAEQGHREVVELLLANRAEVDEKDNHGWTALHFAANNDRREVAELLLAHGANVNAINETGNTPLELAVTGNHKEMAAVLRRNGGLQSLQEKFAPLEKIAILPIVDARTDKKGGKVNLDKLRKMAANVLKSKHYEAVETNSPQPGERWTMAIQLDSLSRVTATVSGLICDAQSATKSEECKGRAGSFGLQAPRDSTHRCSRPVTLIPTTTDCSKQRPTP